MFLLLLVMFADVAADAAVAVGFVAHHVAAVVDVEIAAFSDVAGDLADVAVVAVVLDDAC